MNNYIFDNKQADIKFVTPDTVGISLRLGFGIDKHFYAKLARVRAIKEKENEAMHWLEDNVTSNYKVSVYPIRKTNNYLVDVFVDGHNLNNQLLEKEFVTRHKGRKK